MNILQSHTEQIKNLCRHHSIEKLYAFGSAVKGNFSAGSDIDLVVRFKEMPVEDYADNYFEFLFSLEKLFKRPVDLLEEQAIRNPYLKKSIEETKQILF